MHSKYVWIPKKGPCKKKLPLFQKLLIPSFKKKKKGRRSSNF